MYTSTYMAAKLEKVFCSTFRSNKNWNQSDFSIVLYKVSIRLLENTIFIQSE